MTVTIVLFLFSGFSAVFSAAYILAPELIPHNIPSFSASCFDVSKASESLTVTILSIKFLSVTSGINPAPIPCMEC
jgi:hypothetical protein